MRNALACLGACCLLGAVGCGDAALKERVAALEKENQQLRAELEKARKAEDDARMLSERERKAREQCANNLKQIGLALHRQQGQKVTIPMLGDFKSDGWAERILPYLEQGATRSKPAGEKKGN